MGSLTGLVPVLFAVVVLFAACVPTEEGERVGVEQLKHFPWLSLT